MKSVLRFLAVIMVITASVLGYNMEDRNPISFQGFLKYRPLLPRLIDPFPPQEKTLCLKSSHPFWNGRSIGKVISNVHATKKLNKIKHNNESGIIEGTLILYHRYEQNDLQIPSVMTLEWYSNNNIEENAYEEFKESFIKKLKMKNNTGSAGKNWTLYKGEMGNIPLELSINGNITLNGALVFEEKDLVVTNQKDSKNWDLEIEQTQRFNIMGTIGERFFIDIAQDSEADFAWENDLNIEYRGKKNEILKKAEAGNITIHMDGFDRLNPGGNNSSLFGIKMVNQLGPVEIESVIAREQVKKAEKTMTGGMVTGDPISIYDYNYLKDRYFFIDDNFSNNFYPLDANYKHTYDPNHVIGNYEVYQFDQGDVETIYATAYLDPTSDTTHSVPGNWIRLDEQSDYEINRLLGYIRLNTTAQNAIAIAYTTTGYDANTQTFDSDHDSTGTNFKSEFTNCINTNEDDNLCDDLIRLKLLKDINSSTPNSPTWNLMFKNVYSIGSSNIDPNSLEVEIVRDEGAGLETTHSDNGNSYLSIFGLDSEDQNQIKVEGGDGRIDIHGSIINFQNGELLLPVHLPFAYDNTNNWGNNHSDLTEILPALDIPNKSPSMYYDNNTANISDEHEFLINVKTSTQSSSMELGFMIVEGSETVRLGNQILQKDVDYTIDYFAGDITFISEDALDPGANISVTYEENQFISFDQRLFMGTYLKYLFGENNYLAGGMLFYNQSIAEDKVDIGYEPMRNFGWEFKGRYEDELGFLTRAVDFLPLVQTTKPSQFSIEGNYAEIIPNPNPMGQAFIDDFESAKTTTSLSIMQRPWKMASPPDSTSQDSSHTIHTRGKMYWYNPYEDELTKNIWPEQSTSNQANNNTIKILEIKTDFKGDVNDPLWNGIMMPLYNIQQGQSKYLDMWLNAKEVQDNSLKLYIDIGHISEDWNNNGRLDTEDFPIYTSIGDGILSDGEDIGVDNCTNSYEDGWGGCLCNKYNDAMYNTDLEGIYNHQTEFCENGLTYVEALDSLNIYPNIVKSPLFDENGDIDSDYIDPNGDDWCYNLGDCDTDDYSRINGTEGNGLAMGYRYPDTEDMDKNNTLNEWNNYFTTSINPLQNQDDENTLVVTETQTNNIFTGWKLFRIPLISFDEIGDPDWDDVRSFRLRIESNYTGSNDQIIKIAKIELVENKWKEMGIAEIDYLTIEDSIHTNPYFSVEVINTDESTRYKNSLDVLDDMILEHDAINDIYMKEQSLVLSFIENPDKPDSSGLPENYAALIKKTISNNTNADPLSYLAYEKMKMYVYGGDPESNTSDCWYDTDALCEPNAVDLLFRFGKDDDDNYYEIRQHVYQGWDVKNHIDINIDQLTKIKIPIINSPAEILDDLGLDGCPDNKETGNVDEYYGYGTCLDTLTFTYYCNNNDDLPDVSNYINIDRCNALMEETSIVSDWDPNGDNYDSENNPTGFESDSTYNHVDLNGDGLITQGEGEPAVEDFDGDGIYTPHPLYDYENELYIWNDTNDIKKACNQCTELRIKGEPAINNIQNFVAGVVNNSSDKIYGKVLINELRMTGIKKSRAQSYSVSGSLNFADLMTINGGYVHKDAGFHALQTRLGEGDANDYYHTTIQLYPNIILPAKWGIKTPITLTYTNSIGTPKNYPGTDILADTDNINFNIADIQTRDENITLSTTFNKSTRSTNWLMKRTIDNISLSYTAIRNKYSDIQIQKKKKQDYQISGSYTYAWGKENYISPFKFTKDWLIIGNILSQSRLYYTPDKFSSSITFYESDQRTTQVNNDVITRDYNFNMHRQFTLNHKFTKVLGSNYTLTIDSDLYEMENDKWKIIQDMDPGRVENLSENFTNTYKPDFLKWLNPNITYNPTYTWNLNPADTTADITSSTIFKTQISLNLQEFIELIYTPEKKGRSSRGRGRGRGSSSSNNNEKKINIKNPLARFILSKIHSAASKLRSVSSSYTYSTSHDYNNIRVDISPSYLYRFGLQGFPLNNTGVLYDTSNTNNVVGSFGHSYSTDFRTSTNINIISSINTSLEYIYENSLSNSSTGSITESKSFSYYPLGNRGDEGFPIANWSINWSNIEKIWILNKIFKSVSLSHGFNGEQSMTYSNSALQSELYSFAYSPIIGITSTTKGLNPITLNANYSLHQTITNFDDQSTERNHTNQISTTIKVKKSGGFRIKTFFFRDFYIKNNMDFSLTYNYNTDRTLKTDHLVENITDFHEDSKSIGWSIKPNMGYSFTRWVTGNFYLIYGITQNQTTGRNEEKDFGFTMNIKIQG